VLNLTGHVEVAGKFGRIRDGHLDEDHVVGVGQVVVAADLAKFVVVTAQSRLSGSFAMNLMVRRAMSRMKSSAVRSKLTSVVLSSKARANRDAKGHTEDGSDEDCGDLDTVGAFENVRARGVDEDQRYHTESDGQPALPKPPPA
jgi:hypothetical protein